MGFNFYPVKCPDSADLANDWLNDPKNFQHPSYRVVQNALSQYYRQQATAYGRMTSEEIMAAAMFEK